MMMIVMEQEKYRALFQNRERPLPRNLHTHQLHDKTQIRQTETVSGMDQLSVVRES